MSDTGIVAAVLLVGGPLVGAIGVGAVPAMWRVWTTSREEHLRIVGEHRVGWALANAGFTAATVATTAGLAVLAFALDGSALRTAILAAVAVAYGMGGVLWIAIQGIRLRTTPALADLVACGSPTEPAETLMGAAIGGMFAVFTLVTAVSLVALGVSLTLLGGIAAPVALVAVAIAGLVIGVQLRTGDSIPAVLFAPTLLVGVAMLLGWD